MNTDISPELELKFESNRYMKIQRQIGQYRVERKISESPNFVVLEVNDQKSHTDYAMKCICIEEFKEFHQFDHPHILKVIDTFKFPHICPRFFSIVMPLFSCNLLEYMKLNYSDKQMPEPIARQIMHDLLDAVNFIHKNCFCHGNIEPENIFLTNKREGTNIAISSLSIIENHHEFMSYPLQIELSYAAPEILKHNRLKFKDHLLYTNKIDSWSLGIILYELLASQHPFMGRIEFELPKILKADINLEIPQFINVSEDAKNLLHHLIHADPNTRYSAEEALNHQWFK